MKTTTRCALVLLVSVIGFSGCATTYKPAGLTEQQITQKMNDIRQVCRTFRLGDYVSIKFYEGAPGTTATTVAGYFTGYNKMNETISLSTKYLEYSDRGTPYRLTYLSDVVPTTDPVVRVYKPNFLVKAIQNFFTVKEHDNEKAILTQ